MRKNEFDAFSQNYDHEIVKSVGIFGKFRQSMLEYKSQYLKYLLPGKPEGILDFGCGIGMNIPYLKKYFPDTKLYGCDISKESIKLVAENIKDCTFDTIETVEDLKMYENKIDCVFISTVLHHISYAEHEKWLSALYSILCKNGGGSMLIFEMNMKNPLTKKTVERSLVDKDAIMLDAEYCKNLVKKIFGKTTVVKLAYTYFFPWRNWLFTGIEHKIAWLPLGAQYYVFAKK